MAGTDRIADPGGLAGGVPGIRGASRRRRVARAAGAPACSRGSPPPSPAALRPADGGCERKPYRNAGRSAACCNPANSLTPLPSPRIRPARYCQPAVRVTLFLERGADPCRASDGGRGHAVALARRMPLTPGVRPGGRATRRRARSTVPCSVPCDGSYQSLRGAPAQPLFICSRHFVQAGSRIGRRSGWCVARGRGSGDGGMRPESDSPPFSGTVAGATPDPASAAQAYRIEPRRYRIRGPRDRSFADDVR